MKKNNAFQKFLKSMRFRLILLCLIVGILPCLVLRAGFLKAYEDQAASTRSIAIISQAKILADQIAANDYINKQNTESITVQLNQLSNIYDGRVMLIDSAFRIVADTYGLDETKTIISEEVVQSLSGKEISKYDKESRYLEMTLPIEAANSTEVIGVMLVSVSMDSVLHDRDAVGRNAAILTLIIGVLILAFAIFASGRLVRPLRRMEKSIRDIQTGYEEDGLNVNTYTETKEMSESFNQLFGRMKTIDDSRQEFVSNVSHELKTPLTSMKVLADSINAMEDAPVELYKEFMEDITNEIERENKIITDLLSLVKMDKSAADLNISSININEMLELILKRLRPIAEKQNIELVLETFRPVTAEIDEVKLTLAITNLVENAIKYNRPHGSVSVSVKQENGQAMVLVTDTGIGISPENQKKIFDPFFRVDKSRSRAMGGAGLGLALVDSIAKEHGGTVKVLESSETGSTIALMLPVDNS